MEGEEVFYLLVLQTSTLVETLRENVLKLTSTQMFASLFKLLLKLSTQSSINLFGFFNMRSISKNTKNVTLKAEDRT